LGASFILVTFTLAGKVPQLKRERFTTQEIKHYQLTKPRRIAITTKATKPPTAATIGMYTLTQSSATSCTAVSTRISICKVQA